VGNTADGASAQPDDQADHFLGILRDIGVGRVDIEGEIAKPF
jgi:hypothetical protein